MDIGNATRMRILELCAKKNITLNKLATICGITQSTLNNIVSGRNNSTTVSTVKKFAMGWRSAFSTFSTPSFFYPLSRRSNKKRAAV